MKKLNLQKLNLVTNNLLQRNQLKTVLGGGYPGSGGGCFITCTGFQVEGSPCPSKQENTDAICTEGGGILPASCQCYDV